MSTRAPVRPVRPARPVVPPRKHSRRRRVRPGKDRKPSRLSGLRFPRAPRWAVFAGTAAVVLVVAATVWLLLFSSVLGVRRVEVAGGQGDLAAAVREIAAVPEGMPLARVDTEAIRDRLQGLPQVESASVHRSWPSTIRIEVVERLPVVLADVEGVRWLVDRHGVLYAQVTEPPAGIPLLEVERPAPDDPSTRAALEVVAALPPDVRARLARVAAESPDSVVLHLSGGRTVIWGSAEDSERKALALSGVFAQPGGTIDVSSPSAVVVR